MGILFFFLKIGVKINVKVLVRRYLDAKKINQTVMKKSYLQLY